MFWGHWATQSQSRRTVVPLHPGRCKGQPGLVSEESHSTVLRRGARPFDRLRLSRRVVLLSVLWLVPWAIVAFLLFGPSHARGLPALADADTATPQGIPAKPGPWGNRAVPLTLAPPDELLAIPPPDGPPVRWVFQGYTKQKAIEFLRTVEELTAAQRDPRYSTRPPGARCRRAWRSSRATS